MSECGEFAFQLIDFVSEADLERAMLVQAVIDEIYPESNTADIHFLDSYEGITGTTFTEIPFWYHCELSKGTLEDLAHGWRAFAIADHVYAIYVAATDETPRRFYIIGHVDIRSTKTCFRADYIRIQVIGSGIAYDDGITPSYYITIFDAQIDETLNIEGFENKDENSPPKPDRLPALATQDVIDWFEYNFESSDVYTSTVGVPVVSSDLYFDGSSSYENAFFTVRYPDPIPTVLDPPYYWIRHILFFDSDEPATGTDMHTYNFYYDTQSEYYSYRNVDSVPHEDNYGNVTYYVSDSSLDMTTLSGDNVFYITFRSAFPSLCKFRIHGKKVTTFHNDTHSDARSAAAYSTVDTIETSFYMKYEVTNNAGEKVYDTDYFLALAPGSFSQTAKYIGNEFVGTGSTLYWNINLWPDSNFVFDDRFIWYRALNDPELMTCDDYSNWHVKGVFGFYWLNFISVNWRAAVPPSSRYNTDPDKGYRMYELMRFIGGAFLYDKGNYPVGSLVDFTDFFSQMNSINTFSNGFLKCAAEFRTYLATCNGLYPLPDLPGIDSTYTGIHDWYAYDGYANEEFPWGPTFFGPMLYYPMGKFLAAYQRTE